MLLARTWAFFLVAVFMTAGAGLYGDEPVNQAKSGQGQSVQAGELVSSVNVAAPIPTNALGGASAGVNFLPEDVSNLSVVRPGGEESIAPAGGAQNRVLPANVDNVAAFSRETAYSANWLVDGMRRLEAEERRQQRAIDPSRKGGRDLNAETSAANPDANASDLRNTTTVSNANDPLVQYLQKWLTTPEAVAAAAATISSFGEGERSGLSNTSGGAVGNGVGGNANDGVAGIRQIQPQPPSSSNNVSLIAQLTESSLEGTGPSIVLAPPPMPVPAAGAQNATQPQDLPTSAPMLGVPENKQLKIKPITPEFDPNKPLVNDKKYFPQLQRF